MTTPILVVLSRPDRAASTLATAGQFAARIDDAHITALAIRTAPEASILPTEEILTARQEREARAQEANRIGDLRAAFTAWHEGVRPGTVSAEWADVEGAPAAVLASWGRRSDFVVLKRPVHLDSVASRDAVHTALFETGRPVLLVPPGYTGTCGRRITLAWRQDAQAVKTALAAVRFLGRAEQVDVVSGVPQGAPGPAEPDLLREHGIASRMHALPLGRSPFGETLLATARKLGADLLVMGAYAHRPLRERVLGGVTRAILAHADLPVLMRH